MPIRIFFILLSLIVDKTNQKQNVPHLNLFVNKEKRTFEKQNFRQREIYWFNTGDKNIGLARKVIYQW